MQKPTVFLSHSSADAKALGVIRSLLTEKTGGAIALFLSSDGQSIPLGRNWVHAVQSALESCELMFVFLTPSSMRSSWLFFESGFAYSRHIRVVPVALPGVDLKDVAPPLSLLQGFNVTSAHGLNNIVAVINQVLDHHHAESFTPDDYLRVVASSERGANDHLSHALASIVSIRITFQATDETSNETISEFLRKAGVEYQNNRHLLVMFGASLSLSSDGRGRHNVVLYVSVTLWSTWVPIIVSLAAEAAGSARVEIHVEFDEAVEISRGLHNMTARLLGTEVTLGDAEHLKFRGARFKVDRYRFQTEPGRAYIGIQTSIDELSSVPLADLVELLFERDVLFE